MFRYIMVVYNVLRNPMVNIILMNYKRELPETLHQSLLDYEKSREIPKIIIIWYRIARNIIIFVIVNFWWNLRVINFHSQQN